MSFVRLIEQAVADPLGDAEWSPYAQGEPSYLLKRYTPGDEARWRFVGVYEDEAEAYRKYDEAVAEHPESDWLLERLTELYEEGEFVRTQIVTVKCTDPVEFMSDDEFEAYLFG